MNGRARRPATDAGFVRRAGPRLGRPPHLSCPAIGPGSIFSPMHTYTAVVERDPETGVFVGYVPGWPGAHSQGTSLDELQNNLREVVALLLEDGEPSLETEFIGIQTVQVA